MDPRGPSMTLAAPQPAGATRRRLLVVDDNGVNRSLAMAFSSKLGWEVAEADRGEACLERLASESFDVLLLDISMPGLSGEEVLRRLRATPGLEKLKVVAYTAHALVEEQRRLLEAGFDHLLIKPISMKSLSEVLASAVADV